jgi:hypothetical protein
MTREFLLSVTSPAGNVTTLDLDNWQNNGIAIISKDLGSPTVRETVQDMPIMDGSDDQTRYLGQRVVALTGKTFNIPGQSGSAAFNMLAPFLDPKSRSTLTYQLDDDVSPRMLTGMRSSNWAKIRTSPIAFSFSLQWKADPAALDVNQQAITIGSPGPGSSQGRTYPRTYNLVYPTTTGASGIGHPVSNGTYTTWPTYRIYGPCTNPIVSMLNSSGVSIGYIRALMGVPAGQYLEINTAKRTVMLFTGASPGANRYNTLEFSTLVWRPLSPGSNTIFFNASSFTPPSNCVVLWNDAFLF